MDVPPLDPATLGRTRGGEPSGTVRSRVVAARKRQRSRFGAGGAGCNARMGPAELERHAALDPAGRELLLRAVARLGLSARGFDRVRRVGRTLADLVGQAEIHADHLSEALQYRHPELSGSC